MIKVERVFLEDVPCEWGPGQPWIGQCTKCGLVAIWKILPPRGYRVHYIAGAGSEQCSGQSYPAAPEIQAVLALAGPQAAKDLLLEQHAALVRQSYNQIDS
jgi:hypothetical protein